MPRLGIEHPRLPKSLLCPVCRSILDNRSALTHISGCAQCSGINASVKHNMLVKFFHDLCMRAGIPCESEPRAFSNWTCTTCRNVASRESQPTRSKICTGRHLHRSGPDFVIYWDTGAIFYDLTFCTLLILIFYFSTLMTRLSRTSSRLDSENTRKTGSRTTVNNGKSHGRVEKQRTQRDQSKTNGIKVAEESGSHTETPVKVKKTPKIKIIGSKTLAPNWADHEPPCEITSRNLIKIKAKNFRIGSTSQSHENIAHDENHIQEDPALLITFCIFFPTKF